MPEKPVFIFFVEAKSRDSVNSRNEEISKLYLSYLNKIAINEEDQMDVMEVQTFRRLDMYSGAMKEYNKKVKKVLELYETQVKQGKI